MPKKSTKASTPSVPQSYAGMYIESTNALLKMLESPSNLPPSSATALLQLKRLSRSSLAALKEKEDKLLKAKKKVESEGLKLQNLLYEKQHLLREIQLAKELQTKNLDKLATAESTTATELIPNLSEPKTSAEHTKNLDFLAAKLESRKRLTEQLTTAHSTKKQKIAENVSKKEFLSSLPHHLENLAKAAKPLQQYLSVSANNIDRSIYDDARTKLTKELYVLFANLSNANESVIVTPTPKFNSKPFQTYFKALNKAHYNPDEISTLTPSPHSVTLTLIAASTSITFSFIPALEIITCTSTAPLSYLFPDDCGSKTPNETNYHKFAAHNGNKSIVIPPPSTMPSRPYNWCQWLAGMYFCIGSKQERVEPSVRAILKALNNRVAAHKTLAGLLEEVQAASKSKGKARLNAVNNLSLHPTCNFIPDTAAVIDSFEQLEDGALPQAEEDEEVEEEDGESTTTTSTAPPPTTSNYSVTFSLPNDKNTSLTSTVSISCEYPTKPPVWTIIKPSVSLLSPSNLKALQREVNADYNTLTAPSGEDDDSMDYILTHQIKRVAGVFEKLANGKEAGQIGGVRVVKGKDRRKMMAFEKS